MLESTIEEILQKDKQTSQIFLGCFASDELPSEPKYPSCFVANTKPRNHAGEHWVAFYYNPYGTCHFFDSYAQKPSKYKFEKYLQKTAISYVYNQKRLQGFSDYCGHYCLLFLLFQSRNKGKKFFNKFSSNYFKNDNLIKKLINDF
jgi:hypothetical protein